jgi:ABC-type multidrug transport system fused ATPase/permease subunit
MFFANGVFLYSINVIRSARIMHDRMFNAVMRSPMLFFETTPLGTILNRFSRDIYVIDEVLARVFGSFFRTLAGIVSMIAVISYQAPAFLIVLGPLLYLYRTVQIYYLATSRELKRLDATTKSPIFASFQETLGGVSTIRAYRQSARFVAENEARLDRNQEAFFPSVNTNRWLAVRLEVSMRYWRSCGDTVHSGLTSLLGVVHWLDHHPVDRVLHLFLACQIQINRCWCCGTRPLVCSQLDANTQLDWYVLLGDLLTSVSCTVLNLPFSLFHYKQCAPPQRLRPMSSALSEFKSTRN